MFRGRQAVLWPGLLGLVVLWFFSLLLEAPPMEREIGSGVLQRLQSAGYGRVSAEVSGRDVILTGAVSGRDAARKAASIADDVPGVRRIRDATTDSPLALPWLRVSRIPGGEWQLRGRLPDSATRDVVLGVFGVNGSFPAETVTVDVETAAAEWLPVMEELLTLVAELENAEIEVGAGDLDVAGRLHDRSRYAGLIQALESLAANHGLRLVNRIATFAKMR